MTRNKLVLWLSVLVLMSSVAIPTNAQVEEEAESQGGGAFSGFLKILGDAAQDVLEEEVQEEIDDWAGTYKGRIGEVVLVERRGNAVTFKVKYKDVKRSDGVYVTGEVLRWGEVQENFTTTLTPIQEKSGSVKMTIGYQRQDDSDWGLPAEDVTTDQIRLSLVRETHPEKPFGMLVYDFSKTWSENSELEILPEEAAKTDEEEDEGAIELADGETTEGEDAAIASAAKPSITLVKPGAVMVPSKAATMQQPALATGTKTDQSPSSSARATTSGNKGVPDIGTLSATAVIPTVTEYDFYENAGGAKWKNASSELKFPGSSKDSAGFVRTLESGVICPGNNAKKLLETHPQWVDGGMIEGRYPTMIVGSNVKFKAVGALLKGAEGSDGVIMSVTVFHGNVANRVVRKRITSNKYTSLEADLSGLEGLKVQIVLSVSAGQKSSKDWAVWVNPRLTNK